MSMDALLTVAFAIGLVAGGMFSRACWLAGYRQAWDRCDAEWLATAESNYATVTRDGTKYAAVELRLDPPLIVEDYSEFPMPPYRGGS